MNNLHNIMQISKKPSIEPIFYILNNLHSTGLHSITLIIKNSTKQ